MSLPYPTLSQVAREELSGQEARTSGLDTPSPGLLLYSCPTLQILEPPLLCGMPSVFAWVSTQQ